MAATPSCKPSQQTVHVHLDNIRATVTLGQQLGRMAQRGDVILLHGDLGVGKTTLTQAIAQGLEVPADQYVSSPSFALLHEYAGRLPLFHIDCYRLAGEEDVEGAGLTDYIGGPGLTVVEWPDRLGSLQPKKRLDLMLKVTNATRRTCCFAPQSKAWKSRIAALSFTNL